MRKLKQLCPEYKQYENFHNDKIFTMALKRQIHENPEGSQLKFTKKCAKSYFRDKYPKVYKEMTEKDWNDVSKRLSAIFQKNKNVVPALYKFRPHLPNLFQQSKQVHQGSVNFGEDFDLYDDPIVGTEATLPVEEDIPIQEVLNFDTPAPKAPRSETGEWMDRYFEKSSSVTLTLPDNTKIQFNK
jgi:hypothetical protein|tara:strand:- start:3347 stop:3901 length:555 start_codon:yes stop_codon:yes gene_type:complete